METAVFEGMDSAFRLHCRLGVVRSEVLTVLVRDPRLVFEARVRWALSVLEVLKTRCPWSGVGRVRFEVDGSPEKGAPEKGAASENSSEGGRVGMGRIGGVGG
jgi:hypothetical protein